MKISGLLFCMLASVITAVAQSDSMNTGKQARQVRVDSGWYKSYPNSEMVKLNPDEIPSSLKLTLKQERYKGWEAGLLYRNKKSDEYALRLPPATAHAIHSKTAGWFRFDRKGNPIADMENKKPD